MSQKNSSGVAKMYRYYLRQGNKRPILTHYNPVTMVEVLPALYFSWLAWFHKKSKLVF